MSAPRPLLLLFVAALAACQGSPHKEGADVDLATAQREGERAYAAGEWRAAEPYYQRLVAAIPQDAELWFRLGNIYARTDQPDAAVKAYREALVRDGGLGKAWFNMGVIHLRQAANSFLKMKAHTAADDPMARQGAEAYAAVMAILGRHGPPAPEPATAKGGRDGAAR